MCDEFPVSLDVYVVRECYDEICDKLFGGIESGRKKRIVVTGTPGVGKSVLYLDVFRRLKESGDFPKIVTAAFEDGSQKARRVWRKETLIGGVHQYKLAPHSEDNRSDSIEEDDERTMLLYDGVPPTTPFGRCFIVSFCCPNLSWIRRRRRTPTLLANLYVPNSYSSCHAGEDPSGKVDDILGA